MSTWRTQQKILPGTILDANQVKNAFGFVSFVKSRAGSGELGSKPDIVNLYSTYYRDHSGHFWLSNESYATEGSKMYLTPPDNEVGTWNSTAGEVAMLVSSDPTYSKAFGFSASEQIKNTEAFRNHLYGQYGDRARMWMATNHVAYNPTTLAAYVMYRTLNPEKPLSVYSLQYIIAHMKAGTL